MLDSTIGRLARTRGLARLTADLDLGRMGLLLVAGLGCSLILVLLGVILWISFRAGLPGEATPYTLENYRNVVSDPFTYRVLTNTGIFGGVTMAVVMFFTLPMAWLVQRTDMPFKRGFEILISLNILIPNFLVAMGWILLLNPKNGAINTLLMGLLGLEKAPFSVYNVGMMGYVQGMALLPVAYFMVAAAFYAMDPALEESSRMSGASTWQTLARVTLPVAMPAIVASFIYVAMIAVAVFEIPAIIGAPSNILVFSTAIYYATRPDFGLPQYGMAGAYGSIVLFIGLAMSYSYLRTIRASHKYAIVTGKGYRPAPLGLGRWKWAGLGFMSLYFFPSLVVPFLILIWASLIPYVQVPSLEAVSLLSLALYTRIGEFLPIRPVLNTLMLLIVVPTVTMVLSTAISWLVIRHRVAGRQLMDTIAFLPHATPSIIFAISLAYLALLVRNYVPLYGTLLIIVIAHAIVYVSFGTRTMNTALIQIHRELEEAGVASGASAFRVLLTVTMPLISRAILNAWIWIGLLSFREVTMAITLMTSDSNTVLTTQIWRYWGSGQIRESAALGVIVFFMMAILVTISRLAGSRIAERRSI
ncbi:MAG: iron ABC transporter permease [Dehalococcoidia bacterium]|nr:iron ABC transporter permease [Dehalococcoidia bacterium]